MADETPQQIAAQAQQAGFTGTGITDITAIVEAESSGNPSAVNNANSNGSSDYGLAQINSVHGYNVQSLFDPQTNLDDAFAVYQGAGNNFSPWTTFKTGAYQKYLGEAQNAADTLLTGDQSTTPTANGAAAGAGGSTSPTASTPGTAGAVASGAGSTSSTAGSGGGSTVTVDLAPDVKQLATDVTSNTSPITNSLSAIGTFLQKLLWLTYPSSWVRILAFAVGAVALFLGITHLAKEVKS
jgi:hypothetical protein